MSRSRAALALAATALTMLLAGCSGGDDDNPPQSARDSPPPGEQVVACKADVAVSGDAQADWQGKADVSLRNASDEGAGPEARYTARDGKTSLSVFSKGPDFKPNITLSLDGAAYSSGEDPGGLDAKASGRMATADGVVLSGPEDASVELQATFTCGKPEKD